MSEAPQPPSDPQICSIGAPPAPVSDDAMANPTPNACMQCGSIHLSASTKLPVCESCRIALVKFPFPLWVKAAAALVALMVIVSLALSRERLQTAMEFARTKKMVRQERWEEAYESYRSLMATHSDTETMLDYAEAALNSGHPNDAAQAVNSLVGRSVRKSVELRVNTLIYKIDLARSKPVIPLAPPNSSPIRL